MNRAIAVLLVALMAGAVYAADEQWLEYHTGSASAVAGVALKSATLKLEDTAPAGLKPPDGAPVLHFARWSTPMTPDGGVWMAFASSGAGLVDTLYIDSDCDGSLAGEKPIKAATGTNGRAVFPAARVIFKLDGGETAAYNINVSYYDYQDLKQAAVTSGGWYEGDVTAGTGSAHIVLVDYNSNGTFSDVSSDPAQCDRVCIKSGESFFPACLGKYVQIGGKLCEFVPARDGASVTVTPTGDVPMGKVAVPTDITKISFLGTGGNLQYEVKDGSVAIPAGKWRVSGWTLSRTDGAGMKWTIEATDPTSAPEIEVAAGEVAKADIGEPVLTTATASKNDNSYTFMERFKGRYGENLQVSRADKAALPAPSLRIKNADGSYNNLQSFQFG